MEDLNQAAAPEPEQGPLAGIEMAIDNAVEGAEQTVVAVVERVEAVVHTIEHRTFGRASADEPMPATTITGN